MSIAPAMRPDAGTARATKHLVDRERSHGLPEEYTFHPINLTVEWRGPEPEVRWVGVRHEQRYRGVPIEGTMANVWVPDVGEMQLQNDEVVRALTLDISPRVTPEQAIKRHGGTAPEPGTAAVLVIWPVCDPPPEVEDPPPPVCRWVFAYRLDTSDEPAMDRSTHECTPAQHRNNAGLTASRSSSPACVKGHGAMENAGDVAGLMMPMP